MVISQIMARPKNRRGGRPFSYSEEAAEEVLERMAGGENLEQIIRSPRSPKMPKTSGAIRRWHLHDLEGFAERYERARMLLADCYFDQIVDVADVTQAGIKTVTKSDGGVETTEGDMIDHRRLQVHARQWVAARMNPKKYGDKLSTEISGPDGGPIPVTKIERTIVDPTKKD